MMQCPNCGCEFRPSRDWQQFCSTNCRERYWQQQRKLERRVAARDREGEVLYKRENGKLVKAANGATVEEKEEAKEALTKIMEGFMQPRNDGNGMKRRI